MSLTNINNYKKLLATPEDISDAVYAVKAEKSDVLKNYSFEKYPYTFEKSVEIAKENRPDLKALNASVKAMKQYVLLTKRQYLLLRLFLRFHLFQKLMEQKLFLKLPYFLRINFP